MSYPRLPFCLARFLNDPTSFGCFEENIISFTSVVKQKPEMSDEVEIFLKYVLDRSQEINGSIHQENRGDCEYFLSELLLHVDLLGKTVHFLHEIGNMSSLDNQDKAKWKELERVYSEVEREFVCLYNHRYYQQSQKVERKRPGRPSYNIPKDVLVELRGLSFPGVRSRICLECPGGLLCAGSKNMDFLICRNFPTFQITELTIS